MSARIHFIGTIHNDPKGPERLRRALEYESPDIVTVEFDDALRGIWNVASILRHDLLTEIQFTNSQFNQGLGEMIARLEARLYELSECIKFGKKYTRPVKGVDFKPTIVSKSPKEQVIPFIYDCVFFLDAQQEYAKMVKGGSFPSVFKALLSMKDFELCDFLNYEPADIDSGYDSYQRFFENYHPLTEQKLCEWVGFPTDGGIRDVKAAGFIEELVQPDIKLVHVGGIFHCLRDSENRSLFSRLQKYNPTRATLKWYDGK